jgi:UDP-glucose 4-epimerase
VDLCEKDGMDKVLNKKKIECVINFEEMKDVGEYVYININ